MAEKKLTAQTATYLDIGARDEQQDAVLSLECEGGGYFMVLADGMGGHRGGSLASTAVCETAKGLWEAYERYPEDPQEFLGQLILRCNMEVNRRGRERNLTPRSTIVALLVQNGHAWWAHVGDSRLYHFRRGRILARTRDHSLVQTLLDAGEITEDEASNHPDQNRLLRSIGGEEEVTPRFGDAEIQNGDALLLCSDGLWEPLEDHELLKLVEAKNLSDAASEWGTEAVVRAGSKADNVSLAILRVESISLSRRARLRVLLMTLLLSLMLLYASMSIIDGERAVTDPAIDNPVLLDSLDVDNGKGEYVYSNDDDLLMDNKKKTSFVDNGDGTVLDENTGLQWIRCARGQSWTGSACDGTSGHYTWKSASTLTHSFANHSDWRIPTIKELHTLVTCTSGKQKSLKINDLIEQDGRCLGNYRRPTIDTDMFQNLDAELLYWSSNRLSSKKDFALVVGFVHGNADTRGVDELSAVILVRNYQRDKGE